MAVNRKRWPGALEGARGFIILATRVAIAALVLGLLAAFYGLLALHLWELSHR